MNPIQNNGLHWYAAANDVQERYESLAESTVEGDNLYPQEADQRCTSPAWESWGLPTIPEDAIKV